jgi:DNA primase
MSTVDEVKQKLDIVEVIGQYAKLTKAGRNFKAVCPFHNEKTPSFYVFPERQSWHCFGACATGGDVFTFVMKKEGVEFGEALRMLADKAGVVLPTKIETGPRKDEKDKLFEVNEAAVQYYHNLLVNSSIGEKAKNYLLGRGLTLKSINDFQLGISPDAWENLLNYLKEKNFSENEMMDAGLIMKTEDGRIHDRFHNRLMFPIRDARGRTIAFSGREMDGSQPKYMNSPQTAVFDKSGTIYGLDMAATAIRSKDMVVIVEGYMDVIMAHQYGYNNIVASMGTAITEKHINILKKLTKNVALALDPDKAGEEAMTHSVDYENTAEVEIVVVTLPADEDPDEVIKRDPKIWEAAVANASPLAEYMVNFTASKYDLSKIMGKSKLISQLLPTIAKVENNLRRDRWIRTLSKLTKIDYNVIEGQLKKSLIGAHANKPLHRSNIVPADTIGYIAREEYCIALLVQYPELKKQDEGLLPDYFQSIINRELYCACLATDDTMALKDRLEQSVREKLDNIIAKPIPAERVADRFTECALALRRAYLINQEAMRAEVFANVEAENGSPGAALARLQEEGIEPSVQLKNVFARKPRVTTRRAQNGRNK